MRFKLDVNLGSDLQPASTLRLSVDGSFAYAGKITSALSFNLLMRLPRAPDWVMESGLCWLNTGPNDGWSAEDTVDSNDSILLSAMVPHIAS